MVWLMYCLISIEIVSELIWCHNVVQNSQNVQGLIFEDMSFSEQC
jgi:hypothetical protein